MKIKVISISIVLSLFILTSCEKWNNSPDYDTKGLLLKVEDEEHEIISEYEFSSNGKLESSWHKMYAYSSGIKTEYSYEYNSNDLLTKKEGFEPGNPIMSSLQGAMDKNVVYTYEYDSKDRILSKRIDYDYNEYSDINYSMNYSYEYPDENMIIEQINLIDNLANSISNYREYNYSSKGNIDEVYIYQLINNDEKRILSKEEYTYDNMKAPVNFDTLPQSQNNITEKKITSFNYNENDIQSVAYTSTFKYEYTYNNDDYPENRIETLPNKEVVIEYYFYKNE